MFKQCHCFKCLNTVVDKKYFNEVYAIRIVYLISKIILLTKNIIIKSVMLYTLLVKRLIKKRICCDFYNHSFYYRHIIKRKKK